MYFVYILTSLQKPALHYVGITRDMKRRLQEHNQKQGGSYSKHYTPWQIQAYIALKSKKAAERLECYLKSGSGHAFLKKRFLAS